MGATASLLLDEYHALTKEIHRVRARDANNQRFMDGQEDHIQQLYHLLAQKDDELEEQEDHIQQLHRQLAQKNDELDAKDALIEELNVHLGQKENYNDENDADLDIRAMLYREDNFVSPEVKKEPFSRSSSLLPTTEACHTSYASSLPDLVTTKPPPSPPHYSPTPAPRNSLTHSSSSHASLTPSPSSTSSRKRRSPFSDDQNRGLKRLRVGDNIIYRVGMATSGVNF